MIDYTFNFGANGVILSYLERLPSGEVERERISRDENAYLQSGMIIIEEYDDGVLEWDVFRDIDGDAVWQKAASGETASALQSTLLHLTQAPVTNFGFALETGREDTLFRFNAAGQVTHEGEIERNGKVDWSRVDKRDVYEVSGAFVLEREFGRRGAEEWTLFTDADNDGVWAEIATGYGPIDFNSLLTQIQGGGDMTFA